jgi:hypothetical protein
MGDFLHRALAADPPRQEAARDVTHDDPGSGVPMPAAPAAEDEPAGRMALPDPTALLGWIDDAPKSAGTTPTTLTMRTPPPHVGKAPALAENADLQARVDAKAAEKLLNSQNIKTEETATKAMEILLEVPDAQRGKAIDTLNKKAFDNLLEHVPHSSREKFETMIDGVKNPERKLKLWAEFHKSRARNDLGRLKGDVGTDDPVVEGESSRPMTKWTAR